MVFFFIVVLCCMAHHIWDLTNITDIYEKRVTWNIGLSTVVNFLTVVAICVGFGKPYSIAYVAFGYVLILVVCFKFYPGLYEWTDRLGFFLGIVFVFVEYFRNGWLHGDEVDVE